MEIFFADDSICRASRPGLGRLFGFGGILINDDALLPLERTIDEICGRARIPDGTELKWSPSRSNWIHRNLVGRAREDCYRQVLEAAHNHGARAVVVVWDESRSRHRGPAVMQRVFEYAFERVSMRLQDEDRIGIIVADRPGGGSKEEERLLRDCVATIHAGTQYVAAGRIALNLLTTPSHLVRHLQVADLIVGATTAAVGGESTYALPMMATIKPMFIRNSLGLIGATGLKICPSDLINLYHWVLGETMYARAATMSGVALPWRARPYATSPNVP